MQNISMSFLSGMRLVATAARFTFWMAVVGAVTFDGQSFGVGAFQPTDDAANMHLSSGMASDGDSYTFSIMAQKAAENQLQSQRQLLQASAPLSSQPSASAPALFEASSVPATAPESTIVSNLARAPAYTVNSAIAPVSAPAYPGSSANAQAPVIAPVSFSYEYDYYSTPAPSPVFIGSATATPVSSDTPVSAPPVRHKVPSSKHKAPAGAPYPGAKHPAKAPKQPKTNSPSKGPASTSPSPKTSSQTKPLPPTAAVPSSVTAAETTNATMPPPPNSVVAPVPSVLLGALVVLVQVIILVV